MSAARVAAFGWALDVAHDVADHVVQTDRQAGAYAPKTPGKASAAGWVRPMAGHLAGQAVCQGAAVALVSTLAGRPSWGRVAAGLALSVGTHGLLDRRWPVTRLLEATGSPRFAQAHLPAHSHGGHIVEQVPGQRFPNVTALDGSQAALPLHGPHLADQSLHRLFLLLAAVILGGGRRG